MDLLFLNLVPNKVKNKGITATTHWKIPNSGNCVDIEKLKNTVYLCGIAL
jgi:hypothetical protein